MTTVTLSPPDAAQASITPVLSCPAPRPTNPQWRGRPIGGESREAPPDPSKTPPTVYQADGSRSIVVRNESPDLPFRFRVNAYGGSVPGCSSHDASPGTATRVMVKHDAARLLDDWLARPAWDGEPLVFSGVSDCYQLAERRFRVTRGCLGTAVKHRQPVAIVTKNALVTRDLDLLASLTGDGAAMVVVSLPTLDKTLARRMEPRTSTPTARLAAIRELTDAGVPVHLMASPVIPGFNDDELPRLLAAGREAGAVSASYTLMRMAGSGQPAFLGWLARCGPDRAARMETLVRGVRGDVQSGVLDRRFDRPSGHRKRGEGAYAAQIARTYRLFTARLGLERAPAPLSRAAFRERRADPQRRLFA